MKELKFPLLTKDQIEVRVGTITEYGYTLLLYKTSRTDAEILDKIVGAGNWQKKFYTLQGVGVGDTMRSIVVCSVGIYDDDKHEWIWKDDSGTESNVEQDKGVCSDAFKRACGGSCWGIGRELYYTGRIYIKGGTQKKQYGSGYELTDKYASFDVADIEWNENPLTLKKLVITDKNGQIIFSTKGDTKVSQTAQKPTQTIQEQESGEIREEDKTLIQDYVGTLGQEDYDSFFNWLFKKFGTRSISGLNTSQGIIVANIVKGRMKQ